MTSFKREPAEIVFDARQLVDAFNLEEAEIRARMAAGLITSRCERGVDDDAGCWRLTFYHGDRACRFIVDAAGSVLKRATFPVSARAQNPQPR